MSKSTRDFMINATATVALVSLIVIAIQVSPSDAKHETKPDRKSIVFDMKTPKVFYCPQEKSNDRDKMIVKAKPLEKLCEFEGKSKPRKLPSDCYDDVDESEFACDEKKRFMIRLDLAGDSSSTEGIDDLDFIMSKSTENKKKVSANGKKY